MVIKRQAVPLAEHTVPATLVRRLVELVRRWSITEEELLAGSDLPTTQIDPLVRLPVATMNRLLDRARLLTGELGLGYHLGLQERASTFGYVGLAAANASTVGEAIEVIVRYAPLFSTAMSIDFRVQGRDAVLGLHELTDFGCVRDVVLINMMFGLETMTCALTGRRAQGTAELAIPEPAYHARFAHLVPGWRFGRACNRFVVDAATLEWPIDAADPTSLELMRPLCEQSLSELRIGDSLVQTVRRHLVTDAGRFRSLREVASGMHLSRRTLTRRLAALGLCFSTLVEQERRDQAVMLLRSSRLSVDAIARRLDYSSASTFIRAFRGWMTMTPAAYRRDVRRNARARSQTLPH